MPIGKVWIYCLLFVCNFVRLRIYPPRIKLAASNFARWFISASWAGNLPFWKTLVAQKPKIKCIGDREGQAHPDVNISVDMRRRKLHARDAPFVEYRAACGRRIGMCGYTSVSKTDVLVGT